MSTTEIRPISNRDIPQLCSLWNAHSHAVGIPATLTSQQLEVLVLGKPYFAMEDLWVVAEPMTGQLLAALLVGPTASVDLSDWDTTSRNVQWYVDRGRGESWLGSLLEAALAQHPPDTRWTVGATAPRAAFALSDGWCDAMSCWTNSTAAATLTALGFRPIDQWQTWHLDLPRFHPPMDRVQLSMRRAVAVERELEEPRLPWWLACVLGHADLYLYRMVSRDDGTPLGDAMVWGVPLEIDALRDRVWLYPPPSPTDPGVEATLTFLLSELARDLQSQHVISISTTVRREDQSLSKVLSRLGFQPTSAGTVYAR
ncbi:MAG: hypothetical protein KatS3mg111_3709 [Pirellulaceae bacterium]|nr:MAG: hypothetical protein KatS3mg111_3709 [Pirellulaceae bacterium]